MTLDSTLFFATNERPALIPGPAEGKAVFPSLVAPNYYDLRAVQDMARARPVYASFRVASAFNNVANNWLRFCVFMSDRTDFIDILAPVVGEAQVLASSHKILSTGLASVGAVQRVAIPPASDFGLAGGQGRRYLALGFEYFVPTTDWTSGGVDAWLSTDPHQPPPIAHNAGY